MGPYKERIRLLLSVLITQENIKIFCWLKLIQALACRTSKNIILATQQEFLLLSFVLFNSKSLQQNFVTHPKLLFSDHFQLPETLKMYMNVLAILKSKLFLITINKHLYITCCVMYRCIYTCISAIGYFEIGTGVRLIK